MMTLKKTAAGVLLLSMMVTAAACSTDQKNSSASPAPSANATVSPQVKTESQDAVNMKGYIGARIALEKIDFLFGEVKSKDGAFILNPVVADSKEKAVKFLSSYFDAPMAEKIAVHYLTDKKADDAIVTNAASFFPTNLLNTKKEDVTFDAANTLDQVKFTTKEGVTYTMKKVSDKLVLADVAKK
ncbi:hypothetical protein GK047_27965 [Paenibacillus sp. SYP-B3998]|uniref:Fasciclin domain-containing protein n=1 Tax=Paenibacillus sp. SYP-B3998 TaxID=2678564 RepID=A0A6G4A5W3_9BACL|nr:hypothetical protein [Paenibacillus sp. SYP-B3998]NEW09762.1 hypothetical protein [Paenibacillus sp. SYP-B3998]